MSAPSEEMPSPGRCGMPVSLSRRARRRIRLSFDSYLEPTSSSSGTTSCERSKSSCGGRGVVLRSQTREIVDRVRQYFENEKKLINRGVEDIREAIPFNNVLKRTSEATGISVRSILRVHKEISVAKEQGKSEVTPGKKRPRESFKGMDSFAEDAIRRHVYDYFSRKEYPTLNKLKVSLADTGLFEGSVFTVNKLMHKLGFEYKKINSRKLLMEKPEIAAARSRFLKEIVREDCNKIIWLDETWVNAGHAKSKGWTDNTKAGTSVVPVGKGKRLILLHAGMASGWVSNSCLLFQSSKTGDYHEEMNHERFYEWFQKQLLPNIPKESVIVMDNAPYHSKVMDKCPNSTSLKAHMQEWLQENNIDFEENYTRAQLLELINLHKPVKKKYFVDVKAEERGHKVIRLPPYHCHYNPIELIWAQVKGYVADKNKKFTIREVEALTREGIENVTGENWSRCVRHVWNVINEDTSREARLDEDIDRFIISLGGGDRETVGSTEEEDSSEIDEPEDISEDIEGVFPL